MTTDEDVPRDRWGAKLPQALLDSPGYRIAQKLATVPKTDVHTGRPLAYSEQPDAVRRANPQAGREEAIRKVGAALGIDPAVMLSSPAFMGRVADVDPDDSQAMTAAISEGLTADPSLVV